jgi:(4S)-4-hydroxy-5-phosphonooxypentane-2,3-dione isomerase
LFVVAVEFVIYAQHVKQFRDIVVKQAENSLKLEPACHQFDVAQDDKDPTRFFLYEIYDDEAAFATHRSMPHFAQFSKDVADFVADKKVQTWNRIEV